MPSGACYGDLGYSVFIKGDPNSGGYEYSTPTWDRYGPATSAIFGSGGNSLVEWFAQVGKSYVIGRLHDIVEDVFSLEEWECLGEDTPANRQWDRITVADKAAFDEWMAARREYETHNRRPVVFEGRDEERDAEREYRERCREAEARMAALEITTEGI
jgi:hypothetical protein